MIPENRYNSIDLFSGCGGLTAGLRRAGFETQVAIEIDPYAAMTYKLNFRDTKVIQQDIKKVKVASIRKLIGGRPLHLLAGCPPCQGFSSVRRLNKRQSVRDSRNVLVLQYLKFVKALMPLTIMMENVPGLANYYQFRIIRRELMHLGYNLDFRIVNVRDYGVPQSRERLVMVGSLLGDIRVAESPKRKVTVRQRIGELERPELSRDPLQKVLPTHSMRVKRMISLVPKDGGGRRDLPAKYKLECHKAEKIGFNDVYGRLRWDDQASTITGGCLNPSKGRFLHPRQNRVITPREASMLQSFHKKFKFPIGIPKSSLALMIGNALPPTFSYYQSKNIRAHLDNHLH